MQPDPRMHRDGLKKFANQLGVEIADFLRRKFDLVNEKGPTGNIHDDAGQRLVERHMGVAITGDALAVAERRVHRLAEGDADVLDRVMRVDVQVALGGQFQIERRVAGDLVEHVVEKADACRNMRVSGAVEADGDRNLRLGGIALDFAAAHGISWLSKRKWPRVGRLKRPACSNFIAVLPPASRMGKKSKIVDLSHEAGSKFGPGPFLAHPGASGAIRRKSSICAMVGADDLARSTVGRE